MAPGGHGTHSGRTLQDLEGSMNYTIEDSGERRVFKTGAMRDSKKWKGRFDLLPPRTIRDLAIHFEKGANKYGPRNWELGIPLSEYLDSGLRHVFSFMEGRKSENHLIAAIWNLVCLYETRERIREGILPVELNDLEREDSREEL